MSILTVGNMDCNCIKASSKETSAAADMVMSGENDVFERKNSRGEKQKDKEKNGKQKKKVMEKRERISTRQKRKDQRGEIIIPKCVDERMQKK